MSTLAGRRIVLGVTGSIAAYKAVQLASDLYKAGALVDTILTESAQRFVLPLSFSAITHRIATGDLWESTESFNVPHVELAQAAECLLVAPASAHTIARLALGLTDDLLGCVALSTTAPLVIAPAMESHMYRHPATQAHLRTLVERGATIVEPGSGHLASGATGEGRLAELPRIIETVEQVLGRARDLAGHHIVVTAGGTREPIDPVRYITNRSSGKQGYAIAEAARDRGARVTLITASDLPRPAGLAVVQAYSVAEMLGAVQRATTDATALIMAAAVSDYRVANPAAQKIKKTKGDSPMQLALVKTPDILASVTGPFLKIGFAAETEDLLANAARKLHSKGLDLIVANDVSSDDSGFAVDHNRVVFLTAEGQESLPLLTKRQVADRLLDRVATLWRDRPAG